MSEKQQKGEYERCKAAGLLGRLDIRILKKYGTEAEIKARENPIEPEPEPEEEKGKGKGKKK